MSSKGASRGKTRRGSLFLRTAAYSAIVTILTLSAFGLRFIMHEREVLFGHLQERAGTLLLALDSLYDGSLEEAELRAALEKAGRIVRADNEVSYVVFAPAQGPSHVVTANETKDVSLDTSWHQIDEDHPLGNVGSSAFSDEDVYQRSRPLTIKGQPGFLHIGISIAKYKAGVRNLLQIVLDLAGPGLLIGVLTSFLFANRLTRPISNLKHFAQKVASGDLEARVETDSNTELGLLGDTMNHMVEDLRQSRETEKESMEKEGQLREQEILLKEIHHRVKNNLQILSSLLRMQARKASTDEMKGMLKESESRIRSMGLIHEKLYQSNSLSSVDFKSYVDTLSGQLLRMHSGETQPELEVDIDDVQLPLDTAMPCGLIINELVSNSLKYAFSDGRQGRISIKLSPTGERAYRLRVSDNGVGMEKLPVPGERRASLGMSLVEMLADQLNGTVEFSNGVGTTADIQFKETVYSNRM